MRFSIRSQIIFLVIALMTVTMTAIIVVSTRNFEEELRQLHIKLAQDTLQSALQTIDSEYQELTDYEVDTIVRRRELMANVGLNVLANIQIHRDLAQAGILTEHDAQQRSLVWIRNFRYGDNQYFFVYDKALRGLTHPDKNMIGKIWEGYQDLRHRDALRLMWETAQKEEGQAYTVFQWPSPDSLKRVKQLGYFLYYPEWHWIVGTTVRIDDLERQSDERLQKMIQRLEHIFPAKRFAESGHVFIFNGDGEVLIHPKCPGDRLSGKPLFDLLKNASDTPDIPFQHPALSSSNEPQVEMTHVAYFSPLNWYVGASIPQSAIQEPIKRLAIGQSYIILGIFTAGLLIAVLLSSKIARPLEALTQYARGLSSKNFSEDHTQTLTTFQSNSTELDALIQSFLFMETQLRTHLHELHKYQHHLEELVDQRTKDLTRSVNETRQLNTQLRNEIVERTQAEEELDYQHRLLSTLLENLPIGVFMVEAPTGKPLIANAYAKMLLGRGILPDTNKQNLAEVYEAYRWKTQTRYPAEEMPILRGMYGEKSHIDDMLVIRPNGTETLLEIIGCPVFDKNHNVKASLVSFFDITKRKKTEEQIQNVNRELEQRVKQRTAKLEAANKELQSFAYVVSHDLKAPLRGISRLAHWLGTDYADAIDENGQNMLQMLIGRVKRMDNLIEGILQYSRIGRLQTEVLRVNLNELVSDVITLLAVPDHIHISVENPLPSLVLEKVRISQVFQNLLHNALSYMDKPEGYIRISCAEDDEFWTFCVRDNGPGIASQYHEKIFQIFQTLTPRDERESTGIGLALVQKIIELHQGRIWIESEEEQGSAFYFTLPKTPVQA